MPGTIGSQNAGLAVDGNVSTLNDGKTCAHTTEGHPAWWEVSLGAEYRIIGVKIVNRNRARK